MLMGADVKRYGKGKGKGKGKGNGKFKFAKKDRFGNANDVPLGPRKAVNEGDDSVRVGDEGKANNKHSKKQDKSSKWNISGGGNKNKNEEAQFNPKSKKTIDEKKEIARLTKTLENVGCKAFEESDFHFDWIV